MGRKTKSAVIVCLSALWIGLTAANVSAQAFGLGTQQLPQKPQPNVLCSPGCRYVFGQVSDSSKDQFMLDTFTGRLWRVSETGEVGLFLSPVPYRIKDGKYSPLPERLPEGGAKESRKK
ncbi:MAG: hypothetical protein JXL84_25955 [Deltaproteobacteria bacterium]|nr:hypothetical protein [Deltaproteobacteria bacterium]